MTEQIYSDIIKKVLLNKKQIEDAFKVKLEAKEKILIINGKPEDELIAINAVKALNLGFDVHQALDLKNEDFTFEEIHIKSISKRKDLSQIRARIIGTERKALRTIEFLTDCDIVLHDNIVGIIGRLEDVKKASYALKKIISGSKHAKVYEWLEEQKALEKQSF